MITKTKKSSTLVVRLDPETRDELEALALEMNVTTSSLVRKIVAFYLEA